MDTYSYISENGTVRQIEDLIAKAKNEEQDAEITSLRSRVSAVEQEVKKPNGYYHRSVRSFVSSDNPYTWTANHDGFLKVSAMKTADGFTVRLKVNGVLMDSVPYYGTDSSGTALNFPIFSVTLSAWVKQGDQIIIDSDQSGTPSNTYWYVPGISLQYFA